MSVVDNFREDGIEEHIVYVFVCLVLNALMPHLQEPFILFFVGWHDVLHVESCGTICGNTLKRNVCETEIAHLVDDVDWFHCYNVSVYADHNRQVIAFAVQFLNVVFPQQLLVEVTTPTNIRVP
ncbi:hypothetical protein D3C75_878850 [compost metagenome]